MNGLRVLGAAPSRPGFVLREEPAVGADASLGGQRGGLRGPLLGLSAALLLVGGAAWVYVCAPEQQGASAPPLNAASASPDAPRSPAPGAAGPGPAAGAASSTEIGTAAGAPSDPAPDSSPLAPPTPTVATGHDAPPGFGSPRGTEVPRLVSDIASLDVQIAVATTIGDETRVATLREQRAQASTRLQTFTGPDLGVAR